MNGEIRGEVVRLVYGVVCLLAGVVLFVATDEGTAAHPIGGWMMLIGAGVAVFGLMRLRRELTRPVSGPPADQ